MHLTPKQAVEMLAEDRDLFVCGLVEGRYCFEPKYIRMQRRIVWHWGWPYIKTNCVITDGKYTMMLEE